MMIVKRIFFFDKINIFLLINKIKKRFFINLNYVKYKSKHNKKIFLKFIFKILNKLDICYIYIS